MNAEVFVHGWQELATPAGSRHSGAIAANGCRKQEGEMNMPALPKVTVSCYPPEILSLPGVHP
jgi:hypothetical protein